MQDVQFPYLDCTVCAQLYQSVKYGEDVWGDWGVFRGVHRCDSLARWFTPPRKEKPSHSLSAPKPYMARTPLKSTTFKNRNWDLASQAICNVTHYIASKTCHRINSPGTGLREWAERLRVVGPYFLQRFRDRAATCARPRLRGYRIWLPGGLDLS